MIGIKQKTTIKLLASLGSLPSLSLSPSREQYPCYCSATWTLGLQQQPPLSPPRPLADVESTCHVLPSSTPITYAATPVGHQDLPRCHGMVGCSMMWYDIMIWFGVGSCIWTMVGLIHDITEKNLVFIVNELSYRFSVSVMRCARLLVKISLHCSSILAWLYFL